MRQRRSFSNEFKRKVVEEIISGSTTIGVQCRKYQIAYPVIARWKEDYSDGKLDNEPTTEAGYHLKIEQLEQMIGRLALDNHLLKKALRLANSQCQSSGKSSRIISPLLDQYKGGAKC